MVFIFAQNYRLLAIVTLKRKNHFSYLGLGIKNRHAVISIQLLYLLIIGSFTTGI